MFVLKSPLTMSWVQQMIPTDWWQKHAETTLSLKEFATILLHINYYKKLITTTFEIESCLLAIAAAAATPVQCLSTWSVTWAALKHIALLIRNLYSQSVWELYICQIFYTKKTAATSSLTFELNWVLSQLKRSTFHSTTNTSLKTTYLH